MAASFVSRSPLRPTGPSAAVLSAAASTDALPKTTLYYTNPLENSDKVYEVEIKRAKTLRTGTGGPLYYVIYRFGKRGSALKGANKNAVPVSLRLAEAIFEKVVKWQKAKGYTTDPSGTPFKA